MGHFSEEKMTTKKWTTSKLHIPFFDASKLSTAGVVIFVHGNIQFYVNILWQPHGTHITHFNVYIRQK